MTADEAKPNGKGWVRLKLTFTDRVMDDKGVPPIPFKLAAALARYADAETGIIDRSQAFLADVVNVKLRALQLAIDLLAKRGHVVVLKPKGRKMGNRYRPVLRPKDDPDPVHMHGDAHETGPVHVHGSAHEVELHAHETAILCAPRCAPNPVLNPVIDLPVGGVTADRSAKAETTTIGEAEKDGLLDQIRQAIEAAGGKLVRRRHSLQPLRALIATGIPRAEIVASVAAAASRLRAPLGNLDANWLLDHVRDRAVADGYGTGKSEVSATARPADTGPTVAIPGHATTRWPADRVTAWTARWWSDRRSWPESALGETPDRLDPRRSLEFQAALDAGRAEIRAAVAAWQGNATAWNAERLGPPPDRLASQLGAEFDVERVTLRHGGGTVTAFALDAHLKLLATEFDDGEFIRCYRALPSPLDADDCLLPPGWQVKAIEYRNTKM